MSAIKDGCLIPEQLFENDIQKAVSPLCWSHVMFIYSECVNSFDRHGRFVIGYFFDKWVRRIKDTSIIVKDGRTQQYMQELLTFQSGSPIQNSDVPEKRGECRLGYSTPDEIYQTASDGILLHITENEEEDMNAIKKLIVFLVIFVCCNICVSNVHATWSNDPSVNNAICTAAGGQLFPTIISDGSGGAIITWVDDRNGISDIYAQRISAGGVCLWTANGVAICTAAGGQSSPNITSDGSGGAIITWLDYRNGNSDIYAQRISAGGVCQWTANGMAICTAAGGQSSPNITSDGNGGAIITWLDDRNGNDDIYAQRISAGGGVQWTANGVAICTAANDKTHMAVISDGSGGAIITWSDYRSSSSNDIYAQRISAGGGVQWMKNGVAICTATNAQVFPTIISDGSGGAIITWQDNRNGSANADIYVQRISAGGGVQWTANGTAICTAAGDQVFPTIASDGSGGAIITWQDNRSGSANADIYAQRISASGMVQWTTNGVTICTAAAGQPFPTIISDSSGGAIITWLDYRNGNSDIYAQRISAGGVGQWTANGVAISTATGVQSSPDITSDGSSGAIITWYDGRNGNWDIYAQRINANGTLTPVVVTPTPDIKANGQDGQITVSSGTPVSISISLAPGNQNGQLADWWLAASTPWGWYSLDSNGWTPGINLLAQYPLFGFSPVNIFNSVLPFGVYAFYFGVDMSPNGILDSPLYYDFVQVSVGN